MHSDRKIALDTETTGLSVREGDRVIEIGAVEISHGVRTGRTFHSYINPQNRAISVESEKVHGINAESLQDKPHFNEIADDFLRFVEGSELIIHNAEFDIGFLNQELKLCNREIDLNQICKVTDTLTLARGLIPRGARLNLSSLCTKFGIEYVESRVLHGALIDAQLVASLYVELNRRSQGSMFASLPEEDTDPRLTADQAIVTRTRVILVKANEQEARLHDEYMREINSPSHSAT